MTDPVLRLEPVSLMVEPGGQARAEIHIRNPGRLVEGFRLEVLGDAAAWASVSPSTVEVYPEQEQRAIVVFNAPGTGEAPSGSFPFGVRALSVVDQHSADVVEGDLEIGRVFGLAPKLTPTTSTGRWKGRHVLTLTNWGNTPTHVHLAGSDPDDRLDFLIRPPELDLPLGAARTARVTVRTRRPTLRGTQQRLPFRIASEPEVRTAAMGPAPAGDANRPVLDGAFVQRPILSRGFVTILVMALLAGAASAFLLLRPAEPEAPVARTGSPPPPPTGLTISAPEVHSLTLNWNAVGQAVKYRVLSVDPDDPTKLTATPAPIDQERPPMVIPDLAPFSRYCFTVAAVSAFGEQSSLPEALCGETAVPRGSGQLPGDTQWITVRDLISTTPRSTAENLAKERVRELLGAGITANWLVSAEYPSVLGDGRAPTLVVYEGPFDTEADASAICRALEQGSPNAAALASGDCVARPAGPRLEPTPSASPTASPTSASNPPAEPEDGASPDSSP